MTKERLFKVEYAPELFAVAEGDLEAALALQAAAVKRRENIFFSVQQAIEKALKAYLVALGQPVPMVHDLAIILDRIPDSEKIPHHDGLQDLTQFATIRRYESGSFELTDAEIAAGIQAASDILSFVRTVMAKPRRP